MKFILTAGVLTATLLIASIAAVQAKMANNDVNPAPIVVAGE